MAKRWTVAQAIVLAQHYRSSDHSEAYEAVDLAWKDACRRSPDVMPLFFELAQYSVAVDLLKRFNESCSVRKLQSAIEDHKDFSTVDAEEEDEDTEEQQVEVVTAVKSKRGRSKKEVVAPEHRLEDIQRNLNVEELLDLNSLGQV